MRIKLDENLPARLAPALEQLGHDVHTVHDEKLAGVDDNALWLRVQQECCFLVTQDLDFADKRRFIPGTHAGTLLVRLRNPGRGALYSLVLRLFQQMENAEFGGAHIVATEHKIRITKGLE